MSLNFTKVTLAAVAVAFAAVMAVPAAAQQGGQRPDEDPVYFDLGIDVRQLPQDSAGAKRFVAMQPQVTQSQFGDPGPRLRSAAKAAPSDTTITADPLPGSPRTPPTPSRGLSALSAR